jgi:hypothetical protein
MNLKRFLPLLALPLLAACAPEVESTIYLADIQDAIDKGEPIAVPALLRIPQAGEDECKKGLEALVEKLKALAPVTGKSQCISRQDATGQGTQLAEIETKLQIVAAGGAVDPVNLFVVEAANTDEGRTDLTFKMLKPISEVIEALKADDSMQIDFDPAKFIIHINNDASGTVEIAGNTVFADGKPVLPETGGSISLDRRSEVEIRFSDVASTYVEQGNSYWFVTVGPAE